MRPKREFRDRDDRGPRDRNDRGPRGDREDRPRRERRDVGDMQLYRIEVGRDDGVEVRHIVGAIANEGDISSRYIGNIKLFASHSTIELPKGMPGEVLQHFTRTRILNKPMNTCSCWAMHSRILVVSVVVVVVVSVANVVKAVVTSAVNAVKVVVVMVVVLAANVVKAALRVVMTLPVVVVSVVMRNHR